MIDNVEDEATCEDNCRTDPACAIYTYRTPNSSQSPSTCILLTGLQEPIMPCPDDTCSTGPPDCRLDPPYCAYISDGILGGINEGLMITSELGERGVELIRFGLGCPFPSAVVIGRVDFGCAF